MNSWKISKDAQITLHKQHLLQPPVGCRFQLVIWTAAKRQGNSYNDSKTLICLTGVNQTRLATTTFQMLKRFLYRQTNKIIDLWKGLTSDWGQLLSQIWVLLPLIAWCNGCTLTTKTIWPINGLDVLLTSMNMLLFENISLILKLRDFTTVKSNGFKTSKTHISLHNQDAAELSKMHIEKLPRRTLVADSCIIWLQNKTVKKLPTKDKKSL